MQGAAEDDVTGPGRARPAPVILLAVVALLASPLALFPGAASGADERLTVATWNIANLHHEDGVALRDRAAARDPLDYRRLAAIAGRLDADIVLLQEIGSPRALARVFDPERWHLVMSGRYVPGSEDGPAAERDIHTAVAIDRARFPDAPPVETIHALAVHHVDLDPQRGGASARATRAGIAVRVTFGGREVVILGVHLKSACHQWRLDPVQDQAREGDRVFASRFDCRTLVAQRAILESWIEQQHGLGHGVIVAGDFNRRMNLRVANGRYPEDFWRQLDDGTPAGLDLVRGPTGLDRVCWTKHRRRYEEHIDFVVHDDSLRAAIRKVGLGHDDDPRYAGRRQQRLSDHCPVVAEFRH